MSSDQALYVYGFTRAGATDRFSAPGVTGANGVKVLELGEIAAVCSPLSMEAFLGPGDTDPTQDLAWVAPQAMRHEQVIEEVMASSPVLPVTFGAIFSSPRAVTEAIASHREQITGFLDYIADKEEWAVKVYASPARLLQHLERSPEFRDRLRQLPEAPGARYFHQKRIQRELSERSRHEGRRLADHIRDELIPLTTAVRCLRLASHEVTGRQEDQVLNCAFLAQAGQVERFTERVRQLASEYQPRGLTIEATGPWPPYTFCPALEERA